MQEKRRHKRSKLDTMEIHGKMSLADKVELIDISLGGLAIKADRRLNIGKEYSIRIGDKGKHIDVKGIVVRSALSGIERREDGQGVSIYTAGLKFTGDTAGKISEFLNSLEQRKKNGVPVATDRRLDVRFHISPSGEKTLSYPAQFLVKEISLSGMLIHTDWSLPQESRIPMDLSLSSDSTIFFNGRVASCRALDGPEGSRHAIGVEFLDLTEKDRMTLTKFIDYLTVSEVHTEEG